MSKKLINILIVILVLGIGAALTGQGLSWVWAEQEAHHPEHSDPHASAGHGEEKAHGDHGEEHGGGGHDEGHGEHHAAPFSYYLHWLVILLILVPVVLGLHQQRAAASQHAPHEADHDSHDAGHDSHDTGHGHHAPPPAGVPLLVISLVAFMFFLENFSALAHYHQSVGTGFVQFAVKMTTGAFTMLYGLGFKH